MSPQPTPSPARIVLHATLIFTLGMVLAGQLAAAEYHVSPGGNDANPGSADRPFATIARAQQAMRQQRGEVVLHAGMHYLPQTLVFTPADSGNAQAPAVYRAAGDGEVVISGGLRLANLPWKPYRDGIQQAAIPREYLPQLKEGIDQLWVAGRRQPMARFPNREEGKNVFDVWDLRHGVAPDPARDALAPARIARWSRPAGGYVHAMHAALWGDMHWRITGKNADGTLAMEGGWQNNRPSRMHRLYRFVENIFEELDAPGEWYFDAEAGTLYFLPPAGVDLATAAIEVVRLRHLVEFQGSRQSPVSHIELRGLTLRHAARTFMDNKEPLLRSDWTTYRGGAVLATGSEDCAIADCTFDQVGGNTVFVSGYNRRFAMRGTLIRESGGNGIAFIGDPKAVRSPLFNYGEKFDYATLDRTPGPATEDYPADCLVEDCLITRTGRDEKQTAPVQISMAQNITVRHCSIYEVPRAGVNIGDGCWGGHIVEFCDIFDTVLETGDHGSFNSWGRDRYWHPSGVEVNQQVAKDPALPLLDMVRPTVLRNNRWRCDHGWDIDLDDGSSNYEIRNNLLLNGGLKLREGYGRRVHNNITVNNSLHPHVWYENSGDVVTGNIWMGAYRPAAMNPALAKWGKEVDRNLFATNEADRARFAAKGCDANSLVGDPLFVDPASGDFRVKEGSPALKLGFENFPMDRFGVRKAELRKIARTPAIGRPEKPSPAIDKPAATASAGFWQSAAARALEGEEFSAYGVARDAGGVVLKRIPVGSPLAKAGLAAEDLIQTIDGKTTPTLDALHAATNAAAGKPLTIGFVRVQATRRAELSDYTFATSESAASAEALKNLQLAPHPLPITAVTAQPQTLNDPLPALHDGKLAASYGPVFGNTVKQGLYRIDLGKPAAIHELRLFSHNQNGNRGTQRIVVFAATGDDPGWDIADPTRFTPLGQASLPCQDTYLAVSFRRPNGQPLATSRWLIILTLPVTRIGENTAFQEFQVLGTAEKQAAKDMATQPLSQMPPVPSPADWQSATASPATIEHQRATQAAWFR